MSNHGSGAHLKSPGDDPRLDFTDLFAFTEPQDPGKTVLITDWVPFRTDAFFHPDAIYRINIDNNGDALPDVSYAFAFNPAMDGKQTGTAVYATGTEAREPEAAGEVIVENTPVGLDANAMPVQAGPARMFIGVRSDPFFADFEGPFHDYKWTGQDFFLGKNVLTIALEVPSEVLGRDPQIGAWATVTLRKGGTYVQMDRGGNPTINPFITPDDQKDEYNARQPADDVKNYLEPWSKLLQEKGGYSAEDAKAAALMFLPDILRYDRSRAAVYPNGRTPTDDVYSYRFNWLTNGRSGPDGLKPHDDLQNEFPFLGVPNK